MNSDASLKLNSEAAFDLVKGRKIIVLGLDYNVSQADFEVFFSPFGIIQEASIVLDSMTGKSRGFGFITFDTPEAAQSVIASHETEPLQMNGRRIDPKMAGPKRPNPNFGGGGGFGASPNDMCTRIFVGRLPFSMTADDVRGYFAGFGEVEDCYVPMDYSTKKSRGIAFITYTSAEAVNNVMAQEHTLEGRQIAVDRAAPRDPTRPRGGFGGPAGPYPPHGGYGAQYNQGWGAQGYGAPSQGYGAAQGYGASAYGGGYGGGGGYGTAGGYGSQPPSQGGFYGASAGGGGYGAVPGYAAPSQRYQPY